MPSAAASMTLSACLVPFSQSLIDLFFWQLEGVDSLHHLDVLDLHSNRINRVEGLTSLTELRVLNLAGNSITAVEGMEALYALTELNLRRNVISSVKSIGNLTSLSRLFLSSNQISTLDSVNFRHAHMISPCFCDSSCRYEISFQIGVLSSWL